MHVLVLISNLSGSYRWLSLSMFYWLWLFRTRCIFSTPWAYLGWIYFGVCWKILLSTRKYAVDDRLTWTDRMLRKSKILKYKITDDDLSDLYINMYVYRKVDFVKENRIHAVFTMDAKLINPCSKMGVLMYKITWRETHV